MRSASALARQSAPFVLLWLVLHAAVLAIIAFTWGAALVVKAILGWLLHFALFAILILTGTWLVMRLMRRDSGAVG